MLTYAKNEENSGYAQNPIHTCPQKWFCVCCIPHAHMVESSTFRSLSLFLRVKSFVLILVLVLEPCSC